MSSGRKSTPPSRLGYSGLGVQTDGQLPSSSGGKRQDSPPPDYSGRSNQDLLRGISQREELISEIEVTMRETKEAAVEFEGREDILTKEEQDNWRAICLSYQAFHGPNEIFT